MEEINNEIGLNRMLQDLLGGSNSDRELALEKPAVEQKEVVSTTETAPPPVEKDASADSQPAQTTTEITHPAKDTTV